MDRSFLKELGVEGLNDEVIQKIMDEHGNTITANKKAADEALRQVRAERDSRADITPDDLTKLQGDFTTASDSLKKFEGVNLEELNAQLATATGTIDTMKADHAATVNDLQKDLLLRERLAREDFSSDYARVGVYNDLKAKVTYEPGEEGSIGSLADFDEKLGEIREQNTAAFATKEQTPLPKKNEGKPHGGVGPEVDDFVKGFKDGA